MRRFLNLRFVGDFHRSHWVFIYSLKPHRQNQNAACRSGRDLLPKRALNLTTKRWCAWRTHRSSPCQLLHPLRWTTHETPPGLRCCDDRLNHSTGRLSDSTDRVNVKTGVRATACMIRRQAVAEPVRFRSPGCHLRRECPSEAVRFFRCRECDATTARPTPQA